MNGHATSKHSLSYEESMVLLDEKTLSDVESDAGRADLESRFASQKRMWLSTAQTYTSGLRSVSWRSLVLRSGFFLLPSFVQSRISRDPRVRGGEKLGPTSYLDGMRGLAALFVFHCHYFYTCFIIAKGWGYQGENYHFLKLPYIRLFYQGPPFVCVFFVISGYALSLKPLKMIRARNTDGFSTTMSSFVFRRVIRLYGPTMISTLLIITMIRLGIYEWTRDFANDKTYLHNVLEPHYQRFGTTYEQFMDWAKSFFNFFHIWGWEPFAGSMPQDVHLWTIPVEFRASMMLFLALIGLARVRTSVRFTCLAIFIWFAYKSDRWEMMLFFAGMWLAELDLIRGAHFDPSTSAVTVAAPPSPNASLLSPDSEKTTSLPQPQSRAKTAMWIVISIIALYLMGQPDQGSEETPGWVYLSSLIPDYWQIKHRYWQTIGSIIFVGAVARVPGWQRFFNSPVVNYLGKISYAIYLMHGPVLHTIGYATMRWVWSITGIEGHMYNVGFVLAAFLVIPEVVWGADLFWRAVDAPVVRFAKWFETQCLASD